MKHTESELDKLSKHMSYILRHNPSEVGGLDTKGRTSMNKLAKALGVSHDVVLHLIDTDSKGRFAFDGHNVWAVQGHSIPNLKIDDELLTEVPEFFYHGTKARVMDSIMKQGLIPNGRTKVHLSAHKDTAVQVAERRAGTSVILSIDAPAMLSEGFKFFRAKNGVILIDHVPSRFITEISHHPNLG